MSGFWTLKRRIMAAIVLLLVLTIGTTLVVLERKMRDAAARGDYLKKHLSRYENYQDTIAGSLLVAAQTFALDEALGLALKAADQAAVDHVRRGFRKVLDAANPVDALVVFDEDLQAMGSGEDTARFGGAGRLFLPASRGVPVVGPTVLDEGGAVLAAAAPVFVEDKQVGVVVAAVNMLRPFRAYSRDSDPDRDKRHQLALVANDVVAAATIPEESWDDLLAALKDKKTVQEGKLLAPVMDLGGKRFDVTETPVSALTPDGPREVGGLALFRIREAFESRVLENLLPVVYVGAGGVLAAILVGFLVARTITRPVRAFARSIRELAAGEADLTATIPVTGRDELAELGTALNDLIARFNELVVHIRDASLRLGQSAQEISHVSTRTFEGAKGQLSRIEHSSSLTNELSRTIQEIAGRATQGAQTAGLGKDSAQKTDAGMTRVRQAVHGTWDKVTRLRENVDKIGAIAGLISKITEENSMLALNASIEAARAGAAGQGFAVVAQQMREQARRVERSSKEIIENIDAILTITHDLVASMTESRQDVDHGSQLVNVTLHHLSELSSIMQETAESVKEQAAASDDIAQLMLEIQRIGRDALEASQQTVDEGVHIRDRARDLAQRVGRFKVQELPAPAATEQPLLPPDTRS